MKRSIRFVLLIVSILLAGCNNPRAESEAKWYLPWTWGDKTLEQSLQEGCRGGAITTTIAGSVYTCPSTPTDTPVPTSTPTTSQPAAQPTSQSVVAQPTTSASQPAAPEGQQVVSCPTEAEFTQLTGVVADVVPSEPCAFHWRGDPQTITPENSCPEGWSCQLGVVGKGNILYYGGSPSVTIYAGTWRLIAAYPSNDAVQQPCQLLAKSQEEGRQARPTWSITAGNFICP
jgi:hypothetical protein